MREIVKLEAFPHSKFIKDGELLAKDGVESVEWLCSLGISNPADRYHSYLRELQQFEEIQGDEASTRAKFERFVNANAELYELNRVRQALMQVDSQAYLDTLKKITQGQPFRNAAKSDPGRDYLFEISIASRLLNAGHEVILNQLADVVTHVNGRKLYIEAKRIKSQGKLSKRISEANNQLRKRITNDPSSKARGIVAINITDVINPENSAIILRDEHSLKDKHSAVFNGFIASNLDDFDKGMYDKCLGVFVESSWHGLISDNDDSPRLFFCRGATFKLYRVSQSEKDYVRDFLPKLANQFV